MVYTSDLGGNDVRTDTGESRLLGLTLVVQARPYLFLETLTAALTATGHVVRGAVPDARSAAGLAAALGPDVCILHDSEPTTCLDAARAVRDETPAVKLLVVSTGRAPQTRRAFEERTVDGVVRQACAFASLWSALNKVARGERYLAEDARLPVADTRPKPVLTARERQVLEHLVRGATTQVIAHELEISPHTVRSHVQGLTRKLGAQGRGRAVRTALSRNLLEAPSA